jgi:MFS family permease
MFKAVRPVTQVLLAVAFMEAGLGVLSPLISLDLAQKSVSTSLIGIVTSGYFTGFLLGTLSCHWVIDRVGHIRAFAVFAAVAGNATLGHIIFDQPYAWIALRALLGYAFAGQFVVIESWLNDKAADDNRGRIFSYYMAVSWAASGVSPLALNFHDAIGSTILFCIIAMLFGTALIPMALTRVGNPEIGDRVHFGIRKLLSISPTGVVVCFGSGLLTSAYYGLLPAYAERVGLTTGELALLFSASTIAGLIIQFPIGFLSDHFGRRPLILISLISAATLAALVASLDSPTFVTLLIVLFFFDGAIAPLYALGVGQTNDYTAKRDFVAASAGLLFAWGLGSAIGPTIAGFVMGLLGPLGLFWYMAASLSIIASFVTIRILVRRALSAREQGNYVAVPQTAGTYGAPELDPRAEPHQHPQRVPDM